MPKYQSGALLCPICIFSVMADDACWAWAEKSRQENTEVFILGKHTTEKEIHHMRNNHAAIFRRSLLLMFAAVLLSACLFGGCSTEDAAIVRQGMPLAELKEAADKILLDAPTCCIVQIGDTIAAVSTSGTTAEHFALFDSGTGAMRRCSGLALASSNAELTQLIGTEAEHAPETLSATEFDLGSGRYIPAYLTENAKLITLECENELIRGICVTSLIDETVQRYGECESVRLIPA